MAYERFTQDMLVIEAELERRHKDKFTKLKSSAQGFLTNQKEAMEMIQEVTKGVYTILENMA